MTLNARDCHPWASQNHPYLAKDKETPLVTYLTVLIAVPLLVLGLVALLRARPEDIPAVVQALARWGRK